MHNYPLQALVDIAEICVLKNVTHWLISPGSRSAPLTLAFSRHKKIKTYVINDERSAAFIALGIAQQLNNTVGLLCTSGSASLNYSSAIAEAFYQNIPLLVLTADRPPEWINQKDGQAIDQREIYKNFIKKSFQLPVSYENKEAVWQICRQISESIITTTKYPKGPVHINVPIREPFYPSKETEWHYSTDIKVIEELSHEQNLNESIWNKLLSIWNKKNKILIVGGQDNKYKKLVESLNQLSVPIISDIISNLHEVQNSIKHHDLFLGNTNEKTSFDLKPDLIITFGNSLISKNIKTFLRKNKPKEHWHIEESGDFADTFQSLTHIIRTSPIYFFKELINRTEISVSKNNYLKNWQERDQKFDLLNFGLFFREQNFSEFETVFHILNQVQSNINIHLANSMSVRYANMINMHSKRNINIYSNRGTSGIDGCNSTVIGHCQVSEKLNILIIGDVAFFYDVNAFWNHCNKNNLRILLINNHGGGIFRMIDGSSSQPELSEFFESNQSQNAENVSKQFGIEYYKADSRDSFLIQLKDWFKEDNTAKIMEVFTDKFVNKEVLTSFKKHFSR